MVGWSAFARRWHDFWDIYEIPGSPMCVFPVRKDRGKPRPSKEEAVKHYWVRVTPEWLEDLTDENYHDMRIVLEKEIPHYEWREGGMRTTFVPEQIEWYGQEPKECSF